MGNKGGNMIQGELRGDLGLPFMDVRDKTVGGTAIKGSVDVFLVKAL
jgi:hypothetical protein